MSIVILKKHANMVVSSSGVAKDLHSIGHTGFFRIRKPYWWGRWIIFLKQYWSHIIN